jgi:hypothetical protein
LDCAFLRCSCNFSTVAIWSFPILKGLGKYSLYHIIALLSKTLPGPAQGVKLMISEIEGKKWERLHSLSHLIVLLFLSSSRSSCSF